MHEFVISGQIPAAMIMPAGGVENTTLAIILHPGPRLLLAHLQDGAVLAFAFVAIGFIPALEALIVLHDGMVGLHDLGPEDAFAMPLKLRA
jgi:hypothetical protein